MESSLEASLHVPIEEIVEEVRKELENGVKLKKHPRIGFPALRTFRLDEEMRLHWVGRRGTDRFVELDRMDGV